MSKQNKSVLAILSGFALGVALTSAPAWAESDAEYCKRFENPTYCGERVKPGDQKSALTPKCQAQKEDAQRRGAERKRRCPEKPRTGPAYSTSK